MSIVLNFRDEGDGYFEAKKVSDTMGVTVEDYLMACIEQGHLILRGRHLPTKEDLEIPTYLRRGIHLQNRS